MRKILSIAAFVFVCVVSASLYAEDLPPAILSAPQPQQKITPLPEGIYGKVSLDLRSIEINDALKYFALKSGLNIVTTKSVTGRVTLIVENVPVKDVFDIMLRSNSLAYDKLGDIYNVMTEEEYKALYGKKFADVRQVKIFRLKYAVPDQAFSLLDAMKSEIGRILVDPDSGSVLCMDSPEKIEIMQNALGQFEQKNAVRVFSLNYAKAKVVEEQLKAQLDAKRVGSIKADERANQVIIQALPERMVEIEHLIAALDRKTKEVLIDTKIIKVKFSDDINEGIQWEGLFEMSEKQGLSYLGSYPFSSVASSTADWRSRKEVWDAQKNVGSYPFSGTTSSFSASKPTIGFDKMHVGMVGAHDFDVLFNFLRTQTNAKILSNPKIAVTDNQEARIHVGERQAYVTSTTTTGQATSTVSEQVNFIDIGIQLSVTPTINEEDYVQLKLKTEISSVIDMLITPSENKIPIVDTSLAETTVLIKQGATVVIGGLRKEEKSEFVRRVPILSKIPFLGMFFQTKERTKDSTELLIMITPIIITGDALVEAAGKEIGQPNIKEAQEYSELERRKKELETYKPASSEFGGMDFKGFKVYKEHLDTK